MRRARRWTSGSSAREVACLIWFVIQISSDVTLALRVVLSSEWSCCSTVCRRRVSAHHPNTATPAATASGMIQMGDRIRFMMVQENTHRPRPIVSVPLAGRNLTHAGREMNSKRFRAAKRRALDTTLRFPSPSLRRRSGEGWGGATFKTNLLSPALLLPFRPEEREFNRLSARQSRDAPGKALRPKQERPSPSVRPLYLGTARTRLTPRLAAVLLNHSISYPKIRQRADPTLYS